MFYSAVKTRRGSKAARARDPTMRALSGGQGLGAWNDQTEGRLRGWGAHLGAAWLSPPPTRRPRKLSKRWATLSVHLLPDLLALLCLWWPPRLPVGVLSFYMLLSPCPCCPLTLQQRFRPLGGGG